MRLSVICSLVLLLSGWAIDAKRYWGPTELAHQTFEELSIFGPAKLHQLHADKISIIGPVEFNQLEVGQEFSAVGPVSGLGGRAEVMDITGPLDLKRFLCHNLIVTGPVELNRVRVYCASTLIGSVEAKLCRFEGMVITCDVCRFEDVEAADITFKKTHAKEPIRLELNGHCVIHGKIVFESGDGVVVIGDKHSEIEGAIEGAKVIRQLEPSSFQETVPAALKIED
jgi:hypothetical protein